MTGDRDGQQGLLTVTSERLTCKRYCSAAVFFMFLIKFCDRTSCYVAGTSWEHQYSLRA